MRIEDYAIIGDTQTIALVGITGSIDWLCLPRFDSGACFAALLGTPRHGRWLITPQGDLRAVRRRYRDDTLILETELATEDGIVRLVDFMPVRGRTPDLVRIVEGMRGRVPVICELAARFDYGSVVPWSRREQGRWHLIAGPDALEVCTPADLELREGVLCGRVVIDEGTRVAFTLIWHPSFEIEHAVPAPYQSLEETERYWRRWAGRCNTRGDYREPVLRSLITLKALTYAPSGGIVAAATTSLPERLGGVRNWDYRYCWLRDATLTLQALLYEGYSDEARAWREWLVRAVAGDPASLQIMYGVAGERRIDEYELPWLPGYEGSRPVRVGNAAVHQRQLDVYGEVMDTMFVARMAGLEADDDAWTVQRAILDWLESNWQDADEGIWETRGPRQQFTYSKVMAWAAFDRAVRTAEHLGLLGPLERWRALRDEIHEDTCVRGYDPERGTFTQAYGSPHLDASLLLIPIVGFLPAMDPRVLGTIDAVERELVEDGLVHRYLTRDEGNLDGLPGREGAFLACSFWLADALVLSGRIDEGRARFERLLELRNDVGLLAEEYEPRARRQIGNFPQAFSHVALVNTARHLSATRLRADERALGGLVRRGGHDPQRDRSTPRRRERSAADPTWRQRW
jgi:GH15 family glucan-1,4-alpha-glucosidase